MNRPNEARKSREDIEDENSTGGKPNVNEAGSEMDYNGNVLEFPFNALTFASRYHAFVNQDKQDAEEVPRETLEGLVDFAADGLVRMKEPDRQGALTAISNTVFSTEMSRRHFDNAREVTKFLRMIEEKMRDSLLRKIGSAALETLKGKHEAADNTAEATRSRFARVIDRIIGRDTDSQLKTSILRLAELLGDPAAQQTLMDEVKIDEPAVGSA